LSVQLRVNFKKKKENFSTKIGNSPFSAGCARKAPLKALKRVSQRGLLILFSKVIHRASGKAFKG
jgi:hypothetical protein